jgi:hypothetical protein
VNQCDGCNRGLPVVDGIHTDGKHDRMLCTQDRYVTGTEFKGDLTAADYEELLAAHRRLVRELDVAWNDVLTAQSAKTERLRAALAHVSALAAHIGDMAAGITETADNAKGGK